MLQKKAWELRIKYKNIWSKFPYEYYQSYLKKYC